MAAEAPQLCQQLQGQQVGKVLLNIQDTFLSASLLPVWPQGGPGSNLGARSYEALTKRIALRCCGVQLLPHLPAVVPDTLLLRQS